MKALARLPLLSLALATTLASAAQAQRQPSAPAVTVDGEAIIRAVPDLAQFRTGVTTQGRTAREASEANAKATTAVVAALRNSGVAERDIQTARLSLQPIQDANSRGPTGRIASFQASNQVSVRVRDLAKVAEILDAAVAAGANEIAGVDFLIAEPSRPLDTARGEAFADARRKAELYAKAAGVGLGRTIDISEHGGGGPDPMMMRAAPSATATPILPGERTVRLSITVTFQLLP